MTLLNRAKTLYALPMATLFPDPGAAAVNLPRAYAPARPKSADNLVYLAVALGYILLLPSPIRIDIAGSPLPPYRFLLIPAAFLVVKAFADRRLKLVLPDVFIIAASAWIVLAMFMNTGGLGAVTASIANTVDMALAYFFARLVFQTPRDLRLFLILMAPGLAVIAAILVIESVTHRPFVQETFRSIFGGAQFKRLNIRLGLLRAMGPFPHPILAGIFMASFLPLYAMSGIRGWPRWVGLVASGASFFTLSSAALLALVMNTLLTGYNWLTERVSNLSWKMFLLAGASIGLLLEFGTENGLFNFLTRYVALDTATARYRLRIWDYGTKNVAENFWFGRGYADWDRPVWMVFSVDHYWLQLAMQFGAVVPFIIAIGIAFAVINASRASSFGPYDDRQLIRGAAISLAIFAFSVISVSIWLSSEVWFYMLAGICVSLSDRTFTLARQAEFLRAAATLQKAAEYKRQLPG